MTTSSPENPAYVDSSAWRSPRGRADHIDEIADAFERPVADGDATASFWPPIVAWPTGRDFRIDDPIAELRERRAG